MLIVILLFCGMTVQAQDNEKKEPGPYMSARHLPNMLKWLPAPPDTTSEEFVHDIMRYMWGKKQRLNPERAAIAIRIVGECVDKGTVLGCTREHLQTLVLCRDFVEDGFHVWRRSVPAEAPRE